MKLEAAKLASYHAARLYDVNGQVMQDEIGIAANSAKYMAAEAAFAACERAVLTLGGMGYAVDCDVERWFGEMILNYISEKVLELLRS